MTPSPIRRGLGRILWAVAAWLLSGTATADAPPGRYTFKNGAVIDHRTNLSWQPDTAGPYTLTDAETYCGNLNLDGRGWRLPTIKELLTIVDLSTPNVPRIDHTAFASTQVGTYWTSTPVKAGGGSLFWSLHFGNLKMGADAVASGYYVRCAR